MKRPEKLWFHPLDVKKDEDGGLWYRLPKWVIRAYRLREINILHRIMILISEKPLSHKKGNKRFKQNLTSKYFKKNWYRKMKKESKFLQEKLK